MEEEIKIDKRVGADKKEQLKLAAENIDYEATHKGNNWGCSIKDPAERQIAYQSYCDHIAEGKFKNSWYYDNPETGSHWTTETIEKWIKNTNEFEIWKMKLAEAKGFGYFEKQLRDAITGENTKVSIPGLQMAMRHKFGWDKIDRKDLNTPEILASYERVMLLLADKQKSVSESIEQPIEHERIEIHPDNKA